jgi:hypothetical protein
MDQRWVFFASKHGDQWFWRLEDRDTRRVVELSLSPFPTFEACIKNAEVHGYNGPGICGEAA